MFEHTVERRFGGWRGLCASCVMCALVTDFRVAAVNAADAKVTIDNFSFSPEVLSIKLGTTVLFENHDDIPHSVVGVERKFRSKALDTEQSFSMTFDSIGEVTYFCGLHPHMRGKIVVSP
jgi:plastocyanin